MESEQLKKPLTLSTDNQFSLGGSRWLAENVDGVNNSVQQMLKLIDQKEGFSSEKDEMYSSRGPELVAHIKEISDKHQLLAERYGQLSRQLLYSMSLTPKQKLNVHKGEQAAVDFDSSHSSGGDISDVSLKESSEFSSSLSSDSDSESYNSSPSQCFKSVSNGAEVTQQMNSVDEGMESSSVKEKLQAFNLVLGECEPMISENKEYVNLFSRVMDYEEELRVSNKKLQLSEEEIARMKSELERHESVVTLVASLKAQLESAQRELRVKEADLEVEKKKADKLQTEVAALESQELDSNFKIGTMEEELQTTKEKLAKSQLEITKLQCDLMSSQQFQGELESAKKNVLSLKAIIDSDKSLVSEMQQKIVQSTADISERDQEIGRLSAALKHAQESYSLEISQLQSHISSLSAGQTLLELKIEDRDIQKKSLESEVRKFESEMIQMKSLHATEKASLLHDAECLKLEISNKGEIVQALNSDLDRMQLKYDMLMVEKDEVNAKLETLCAELSYKDDQIQNMRNDLHLLRMENIGLIAGSESAQKQINSLKLRVEELEKEVYKQEVVISDGAEEKREAIRQLCLSIEHYRSIYKELRQAYKGLRRHAVMTL